MRVCHGDLADLREQGHPLASGAKYNGRALPVCAALAAKMVAGCGASINSYDGCAALTL